MRKHTSYTEGFDGQDFSIDFEAVEGTFLKQRVQDKVVIAYLVYDDSYRDVEDLMGDGCGELISFHWDNRKNHHKGFEALGLNSNGEPDLDWINRVHMAIADDRYVATCLKKYPVAELLLRFGEGGDYEQQRTPVESDLEFATRCLTEDSDYSHWDCVIYDEVYLEVLTKMWGEPEYFPGNPDAQLLSVYSHSGEHWSLSGQGMQCEFDTCNSGGVWIPDEYIAEELSKLEPNERRTKAREYCQSFLDEFNNISSGQVYGCVVQTYDEDGNEEDTDSCWGFVGWNYARDSLKSEFFDPACMNLLAQYNEDVRTQCNRQIEMELV